MLKACYIYFTVHNCNRSKNPPKLGTNLWIGPLVIKSREAIPRQHRSLGVFTNSRRVLRMLGPNFLSCD